MSSDPSVLPSYVARTEPYRDVDGDGPITRGTKRIVQWLTAVFPLGAGAWTAYTPTVTGLALGTGGTVTGRYSRVGRRVRGRVEIVLGTGFAFSGDLQVTLPVTPAYGYVRADALGRMSTSGSIFELVAAVYSVTTSTPLTVRYAATNQQHTTITGTLPASWSAGGRIVVEFAYEAAAD
ncbi:hypothetical protein [Cellulomonas uda]|uniref:Uncharacterized protein n=1 Tax=Cellulomonas uda TaxID=1714 RepID=A0A4Y3K604_CELUD|nr:hypothetical protein [Cellulomonas uda]NII67824.1 hypothetical protein [Cellulomonas uda]GEA79929.1 hypothetical protein CUD01_03730 [Cellulomonas uda]